MAAPQAMVYAGAAISGAHKEIAVDMGEEQSGLREKLSRQGEEALARIAEELVGNPLVNAALGRALGAREKAVQAQEAAMGALNIPSAADIERLTRRLRSVSQRLEAIEDAVDGLDERLEDVGRGISAVDERLEQLTKAAPRAGGRRAAAGGEGDRLAARLDEIAADLRALRAAVAPQSDPPPRAQERLTVTEP